MICVPIVGPSYSEAKAQIKSAALDADLIELRLDLFTHIDLEAIGRLQANCPVPIIFTVKDGSYMQLAKLHPDYMDIDIQIPSSAISELNERYPEIKLIISLHDFDKTPEDLDQIYSSMHHTKATFYKMALHAKTSLDALRLLAFQRKHPRDLIAVSMGREGEFSRVIAPFTYACLDESMRTAPGQLSLAALIAEYRVKRPDRAAFALIGYPLTSSISDKLHNHLFGMLDIDATYVTIRIEPNDLAQAFRLIKKLGFRGLSVTTPFKESILPLLDQIDPEALAIGAVNTVLFENERSIGYNTDAQGALDALESETPLTGKRLLILGAGGAARAIAYEAKRRRCDVAIANRTPDRAKQLAQQLGISSIESEQVGKESFDILVNATPNELPLDPESLKNVSFVMETSIIPVETRLLQEAKSRGIPSLSGYKMWIEQAIMQYERWLPNQMCPSHARAILEQNFANMITGIVS